MGGLTYLAELFLALFTFNKDICAVSCTFSFKFSVFVYFIVNEVVNSCSADRLEEHLVFCSSDHW